MRVSPKNGLSAENKDRFETTRSFVEYIKEKHGEPNQEKLGNVFHGDHLDDLLSF